MPTTHKRITPSNTARGHGGAGLYPDVVDRRSGNEGGVGCRVVAVVQSSSDTPRRVRFASAMSPRTGSGVSERRSPVSTPISDWLRTQGDGICGPPTTETSRSAADAFAILEDNRPKGTRLTTYPEILQRKQPHLLPLYDKKVHRRYCSRLTFLMWPEATGGDELFVVSRHRRLVCRLGSSSQPHSCGTPWEDQIPMTVGLSVLMPRTGTMLARVTKA